MDELGISYVTLSGTGFVGASRFPLSERLRAARDAGFAGVGLRLHEIDNVDRTADEIEGLGLGVYEIETFDGWARGHSGWRDSIPAIRTLAERFGRLHVTAAEFDDAPIDREVAASGLADFAAALEGTPAVIAVEPFAWSAVDSYPTALDLARSSGSARVGLMVDVWHLMNTGADAAWLTADGASSIAAVQLNNGPRVFGDFRHQARTTRQFPDSGDLDVDSVVSALREIGYGGHWMIEAGTPAIHALALEETARAAMAGMRAVLAAG